MSPAEGRALDRLDAHERVCAERMIRIDESLDAIKLTLGKHDDRFDGINKAAWGVAGALGLLALGLFGWLFVQVYPPPHITSTVFNAPVHVTSGARP
jgi:hypothetical protein